MSKVIDEVVFKKSIEDMLQYLSDNCLYEFVPYDDTEISNLFSLTPEEAQRLSDLISDEVVSKYKLWSSSKVNDELIAAKTECNDYTDKMLTNISSISIKYVDTLPTSDISTSTIYILKNTGGGNDTLNLYDGGTWTVIGDFVISLDDYYKKSEMDTKLNDKANKTEVLLQDDVIVDKSLATNSNVLTAKVVVDELDLKANDNEVVKKTDISTSIDSTSTNDKVAGAKAVFDAIKNNYSTDEQVIGTWIDGKPVYRKVVDCGFLTNNVSKTIPHGIANLKFVVDIRGIAHCDGVYPQNLPLPFPYSDGTDTAVNSIPIHMWEEQGNIIIKPLSDRTPYYSYVILTYTKTTD